MRLHYIIHAPHEGLGVIEQWLQKNNIEATGSHTYKNESLPAVSAFDMLIIMGGPQSVDQLNDYPYLRDEIALTKQAIDENKVVLGICLGAQIIGAALQAPVEKSPHKEIGIYPIHLTREAADDPVFKHFPQEFEVMHWHSDMPGLPAESILLATSAGCPRQAFRYGDRVYGLQFHMELTAQLVEQMIKHDEAELTPSAYVQSAETLSKLDLHPINQKMLTILDYLAERADSACINKAALN